ncbi:MULTISPECIES: hypothetical protein [Flavobacterium]|uniref:RecT family protein n=1 Tax=Flavobacterium keumense TaxID=1306518 RepID=A0ABY8N314_9FLAO|nr:MULTISPECIES: hypothetical protein [Flavobacterium]WGK93769.1 hypothetical protein MG292_06610 [Flavobacterium keumense]
MSELTITENQSLVSRELNGQILAVLNNKVEGFEKAFVMSSAIMVLKEKLTPEYMKPIMYLQGSNLGFKTDKDKNGGYLPEEVKACLIDAVLLGLQPTGNEFNIIAGNMYPTRQGFGSLLEKVPGLKYSIVYSNPIFSNDKTSATCKCLVKWELNGEKSEQEIEFPIKSNNYATADAILGKAERKARRWLFNKVKGTDIPDGDVTDIPHVEVKTTINPTAMANDKENERILNHIEVSKTIKELTSCKQKISVENQVTFEPYIAKYIELAETLEQLTSIESYIPMENLELIVMCDDKKRQFNAKA